MWICPVTSVLPPSFGGGNSFNQVFDFGCLLWAVLMFRRLRSILMYLCSLLDVIHIYLCLNNLTKASYVTLLDPLVLYTFELRIVLKIRSLSSVVVSLESLLHLDVGKVVAAHLL